MKRTRTHDNVAQDNGVMSTDVTAAAQPAPRPRLFLLLLAALVGVSACAALILPVPSSPRWPLAFPTPQAGLILTPPWVVWAVLSVSAAAWLGGKYAPTAHRPWMRISHVVWALVCTGCALVSFVAVSDLRGVDFSLATEVLLAWSAALVVAALGMLLGALVRPSHGRVGSLTSAGCVLLSAATVSTAQYLALGSATAGLASPAATAAGRLGVVFTFSWLLTVLLVVAVVGCAATVVRLPRMRPLTAYAWPWLAAGVAMLVVVTPLVTSDRRGLWGQATANTFAGDDLTFASALTLVAEVACFSAAWLVGVVLVGVSGMAVAAQQVRAWYERPRGGGAGVWAAWSCTPFLRGGLLVVGTALSLAFVHFQWAWPYFEHSHAVSFRLSDGDGLLAPVTTLLPAPGSGFVWWLSLRTVMVVAVCCVGPWLVLWSITPAGHGVWGRTLRRWWEWSLLGVGVVSAFVAAAHAGRVSLGTVEALSDRFPGAHATAWTGDGLVVFAPADARYAHAMACVVLSFVVVDAGLRHLRRVAHSGDTAGAAACETPGSSSNHTSSVPLYPRSFPQSATASAPTLTDAAVEKTESPSFLPAILSAVWWVVAMGVAFSPLAHDAAHGASQVPLVGTPWAVVGWGCVASAAICGFSYARTLSRGRV